MVTANDDDYLVAHKSDETFGNRKSSEKKDIG